MKPFFLIHTTQAAAEALAKLLGRPLVEDRSAVLFEHTLVRVEPLPPPLGKIFHIKFRYGGSK